MKIFRKDANELIREIETDILNELQEAIEAGDKIEQLDALVDIFSNVYS